MGKISPQERWHRHILERHTALEQSGELIRLRKEGLAILGRHKLLTADEWWQGFTQRASSRQYRAWQEGCSAVGERFGLAPWTVCMACLLKGYQPEQQPHVMEAVWPEVRIITETSDPQFVLRLAYEAQKLGLYVVQRLGAVENPCFVSIGAMSEPPPLPSSMPLRHNAFHIRVDVPIRYPPEAGKKLQTDAARIEQQILMNLGYRVPKRLRTSSLVHQARDLRVGERLSYAGAYPVIDEVYGDEVYGGVEADKESDLSCDQHRRKAVKSRRHKLKKRLIEPYEQQAGSFGQ